MIARISASYVARPEEAGRGSSVAPTSRRHRARGQGRRVRFCGGIPRNTGCPCVHGCRTAQRGALAQRDFAHLFRSRAILPTTRRRYIRCASGAHPASA